MVNDHIQDNNSINVAQNNSQGTTQSNANGLPSTSNNGSATTAVTSAQNQAMDIILASSRLNNSSIDRQAVNQSKASTVAVKSSMNQNQQAQPANNRQIGHYIVGRSLGQGTFGKVRLGTHVLTGEKVAIKILEKDKIKDQSDVERVTREIHILKIVRHPNVIQLYEIIETSKQLFLIMEYANGGELFDYIVKRKRLQETEACKFFQQIISGVEYIHKVRICHRDLKPENLLLDDRCNIKIVDFGLSNTYKDGETLKTACGSPCYAAPEMIAGKRYQGLISDVWSCGIILYAMSCGYLPFEDPNTNKLYKKILNCDYLIPGFISSGCKELIRKILNTDPINRYTIKDIRSHDWFNQIKSPDLEGIVVGKDRIPIIDDALNQMIKDNKENQQSQSSATSINTSDPNFYNQACVFIQNNKHNQVTSTYYLILKKIERETGRNYVFEQAMNEKRKYAQSTGHLSTVNFGSPQQSNSLNRIVGGLPSKLVMNQTAMIGSGFFNRAGPQGSSKSTDGKIDFSAPQQSKKVEQIERIQTKRADSIGGQTQLLQQNVQGFRPTTDSVQSYNVQNNFNISLIEPNKSNTKSGAMPIDQMHYSTQVSGVRVNNQSSQSPNSRGLNMANIQSNASAGVTINGQQTFYMAERLKKNGPQNGHNGVFLKNHHQRHGSVEETAMMVIQSTNDSRVEEMLPNVNQQNSQQHRQNTKSVQMRQTMYNNSYFQKLINNVQGTSAQNTVAQKQLAVSKDLLNIVDQKKKQQSVDISSGGGAIMPSNLAQSIMIKTVYGNGFQTAQPSGGSYVINAAASHGIHSNVISKALAQQKIRKFRQNQAQAQFRNNSETASHQGHILNINGEHSFSQDLTQASSDPLNNTTIASGEIMNNSVINVANLESLVGGSAHKNITQKKFDQNLFTIYRATGTSHNKKLTQNQKGGNILLSQGGSSSGQQTLNNGGAGGGPTVYTSYTNRFDSTLNNSIVIQPGQDYTPFTSATTGQSSLLMVSADVGSQQQQQVAAASILPMNSTAVNRFYTSNTGSKAHSGGNHGHNRFLSQYNQHGSSKQSHQIPVFQQQFQNSQKQQQQTGQVANNANLKTTQNAFYSSVNPKNLKESPLKESGWIGENMIALGSSNKQAEHIRMKLMNGTSANFHAHSGSAGGNNSNTAAGNKRIVIL